MTTLDPGYTVVSRPLRIFVEHTAAPQGSKKHVGNGRLVESSKRVKPYRAEAEHAARAAMRDHPGPFPFLGPVKVTVVFWFARPASHYGTGRNVRAVKASAPDAPDTRTHGDVDKLVRSTLDALAAGTGAGVFRDDAQVTQLHAEKLWAVGNIDTPGVSITVTPAR